jgi:diguanylate cyclase (GGDEF)-like protein
MPSGRDHLTIATSGEAAEPMSGNGIGESAALKAQLARMERRREQIAKSWLVDVILDSPLAELERMPMAWATGELPQLISDILVALGEEAPKLDPEALSRAAHLAELRAESAPARLAREIAALQSALLAMLREELAPAHPQLFAEAAERLAAVFGLVAGTAVDALFQSPEAGRDPLSGLPRAGQMRRRLGQLIASQQRYGTPFAVILLDIEGPGAGDEENAPGHEVVLAVVAAALRDSIRLMDEAYRLEDDELCVLAPNQGTGDGVEMAHRLSRMLASLETAGGLRITISAGIVSCPEHGEDADRLLRQADTAMWRARATGQPVTVGGLQDH